MINDKIAAAKQAKRLHLVRALLFVLLLSITGLAVIFWASLPEPSPPAAGQTEPAVTETLSAAADDALLRQAYLDAFAQFENTLRPELNKIDLPEWNKPLAQQLTELEKQAISRFGAAEYDKALMLIKQLMQLAENTISDSQKQFADTMQTAQTAFDDNDYSRAKPAIDKALMLDNTSTDAQKLAVRVAQLPEIADLVIKINTANAENNRQRELELINQLLKLTPEREVLKQRSQQLTTAINSDNFQQQINQAYQALENTNLPAAQASLAKAKQLYPDRSEVQRLAETIAQYQQQQKIRQLQTDAAAAESADDWAAVKKHLQQIQALQPDDKANTDKLLIASDIVELQQTIDAALSSPYRLADKTAADTAQAALNAAREYQNKSAKLAAKSQQLDAVLTAIKQPVAVNIRSDNQTHISVRGVGNVGMTEAKTIQLKPGNYTFEGKRAGYKSKLQEVQVPLDQTSVTVTLICDEAI